MFTIMRALAYAAVFVGFVLVLLPSRLLVWFGFARPATVGPVEIVAGLLTLLGIFLALWCVLVFATAGRGTPAPFDPPRRLVIRGPYRFVRNPMYLGAGLVLVGAAVFFRSLALLAFAALLLALAHAFVRWFEEPRLRRSFGREYEEYCSRVRRWWPAIR